MLNKMSKKGVLSKALVTILILCMLSTVAFAEDTKETKPIKTPFDDVNKDPQDWYKEDLLKAIDRGLISGKTPTKYDPDAKVTVAEWVEVLFRIGKPTYYKVPEKGTGKWYDKNFLTMFDSPTQAGRNCSYLRLQFAMQPDNDMGINWDRVANKPITRADAAGMAVEVLTNYNYGYNLDLGQLVLDANIYEFREHFNWAPPEDMFTCSIYPVSYAVTEGIMDGFGEKDGMLVFKPMYSMDRRQLAVLANRLYDYAKKNHIDMDSKLYIGGKQNNIPLKDYIPPEVDMDYEREDWESYKFTRKQYDYTWDYEYEQRPSKRK